MTIKRNQPNHKSRRRSPETAKQSDEHTQLGTRYHITDISMTSLCLFQIVLTDSIKYIHS